MVCCANADNKATRCWWTRLRTRRLHSKEFLTSNQNNKGSSVSAFAPRTEERIQKCSSGETYRWRHAESHFSCSVCMSWLQDAARTGARNGEEQRLQDLSKQGLTGLKGDSLKNVVRHLNNTFTPVFDSDINSEPCE